jgi:hypothetical protein
MQKTDIGMVSLGMVVGGQEVIRIKAYRDGLVTRIGSGAAPVVPIAVASKYAELALAPRLISKIPDALLLNDIDYVEENIQQEVLFELEMNGIPTNGWVGERTLWKHTRIVRFRLDINTTFRQPILAFVDSLIKDAIGHTNSWYFDGLVLAAFAKRSSKLPTQTLVLKPENEEDFRPHLANFLEAMRRSQRKWNFIAFPEGKYYSSNGKNERLVFRVLEGHVNFAFVPI